MDVNALNNFHLEACLMGETNHVFNFIDRPDVTDSDVVKRADHTFNPGTRRICSSGILSSSGPNQRIVICITVVLLFSHVFVTTILVSFNGE